MIYFNDDNFQTEVIEASKTIPVFVDFFATWCGPCMMISPIIEELAKKYDGKIKIGKIDVDQNPKTAMQFGIRSIPTMIIFKDGNIYNNPIIGFQNKQSLEKIFDNILLANN